MITIIAVLMDVKNWVCVEVGFTVIYFCKYVCMCTIFYAHFCTYSNKMRRNLCWNKVQTSVCVRDFLSQLNRPVSPTGHPINLRVMKWLAGQERQKQFCSTDNIHILWFFFFLILAFLSERLDNFNFSGVASRHCLNLVYIMPTWWIFLNKCVYYKLTDTYCKNMAM